MGIISEYTLWLSPLCLVAGIAVSYALYRFDRKLKDAPCWVRRLLFGLRAFAVGLLLFLLLGPCLERSRKHIEKPAIAVLHDNSTSILLQKDSAFYTSEYLESYRHFVDELSKSYMVETFTFGESLQSGDVLGFDEKETDISSALQDLSVRYYNQNLGAIVLATDGIYNAGENPRYAAMRLPTQTPIYSVALGDTVQECDNVVARVLHNKIAFRGNPFPVKIFTESHALKGRKARLTVSADGNTVFETSITPSLEHYFHTTECALVCDKVGKKIFTVSIEYFEEEISERNNTYTFAVDVLESRQKILLAYDAVHPDVAAIRRAIEGNKNFECEVVCVSDGKNVDLNMYNCAVLVGLPTARGRGKTILNDAIQSGLPSLVVYNQATDLEALNAQNTGIRLSPSPNSFDEAKPFAEPDFSLFAIDGQSKAMLAHMPPLIVPYGNYIVGKQCYVACSQKIGEIETERPLVAFSMVQNVKIGLVLGEGLWRWRLFDRKDNGSFEAFDAFVNKIISYLALTEKRELFAVNAESFFAENQPVMFTAELYDKTFSPLPGKEISLVVSDEDGTQYSFAFSPNDNFYQLNAGKFPQGAYTYQATTTIDGATLAKSGSFVVTPLQTEYKQTRANHALLADLSAQTGGEVVSPRELDELIAKIKADKNIVSVSHTAKSRDLLLDLPFVLVLLLVVVAVEWFLRKFYASY